jgi:broad-specificity NMP kinase
MRAVLVTGAPGVGKSTVARAVAAALPLAAHVEADVLQQMLVHQGLAPAEVVTAVLTADDDVILERDAGRDKHTAANYAGIGSLVLAAVGSAAAVIDTTSLSAEETAAEVLALVRE